MAEEKTADGKYLYPERVSYFHDKKTNIRKRFVHTSSSRVPVSEVDAWFARRNKVSVSNPTPEQTVPTWNKSSKESMVTLEKGIHVVWNGENTSVKTPKTDTPPPSPVSPPKTLTTLPRPSFLPVFKPNDISSIIDAPNPLASLASA